MFIFSAAACTNDTMDEGREQERMNNYSTRNNMGMNNMERRVDPYYSNRGNTMDRMNQTTRRFSFNQNARFEVGQAIADKLTKLREVERANVLVTDNNCFVAVDMNDRFGYRNNYNGYRPYNTSDQFANDNLTSAMKDKIRAEVKKVDHDVKNVYISANPDFVERMNGYATQIRQGRPGTGFVNEFSNMIERVFPMNATRNDDMRMKRNMDYNR